MVRGRGKPLIVLESGCGDGWLPWSNVFTGLARLSQTLAYSRSGYGRSTALSARRDLSAAVQELRQLLRAMGAQPPYVLVGHSLGGLIVQKYAAAHPQEVAGLVLVDPTHSDLVARMWRDTPEDASAFELATRGFRGVARQELDELNSALDKDLSREPMAYKGPVIVLGAWLEDFAGSQTYQPHHRVLIRETAALYPQAQLREIDSKHYIQCEQPQAVIDAVHDVLALARNEAANNAMGRRLNPNGDQ
jgi:pimeloyl-ACP methyl ester carboxylesterase